MPLGTEVSRLNTAAEDVKKGLGTEIPQHLQSPLFKGYRYPHDCPNHYTAQQYLPNDLKNRRYYTFGQNKTEAAAKAYAEAIGSLKAEKK